MGAIKSSHGELFKCKVQNAKCRMKITDTKFGRGDPSPTIGGIGLTRRGCTLRSAECKCKMQNAKCKMI